MKTIVALVDFSDLTFSVLRQAHDFAKALSGKVVIVHVLPLTADPEVMPDEGAGAVPAGPTPGQAALAADKLEALVESLDKFGIQATAHQLHGSTVPQVLKISRDLQADFLIVGSHGHGALYNLLIGTVTWDLLKEIECPMLIVPARVGPEPEAEYEQEQEQTPGPASSAGAGQAHAPPVPSFT
jgi:nucleotide-binding universal stress UspA family protein